MKGSLYEYGTADAIFEGYRVYPAHTRDRVPCVLLAHDWRGPGYTTFALADTLAEKGFAAFAIDLYGKGRRGGSDAECAALMQPFIDDRTLIERRFRHALDVVHADARIDSDALAAIGHCFGGLCVLDMARVAAPLRAVISVHGVLAPRPGDGSQRIHAKVLLLHGHEDPLAPPGDVAALADELTRAGADWQLHTFGHARHAFTVPTANNPEAGVLYDARASARSSRLIADFLAETLGDFVRRPSSVT